jgi:iron complex transport system permease protein
VHGSVSAITPAGRGLRPRTMTVALAVTALVLFAVSLFLGESHLPPTDVLRGLLTGDGIAGTIARELRLPRAGLGLVVGAALGASGAALQGLFRNPLAEPGVTGVTSAAGLGAVVAIYFGFAQLSVFALPVIAIGGALFSSGVLYLLSRSGTGAMAMVLAGVAVASLATALTALTLSLAPNPYAISDMVTWMLGSLKDTTLSELAFAAPLTALGIALLLSASRGLDALTLGEETASSLGIDVASVRGRVVLGVALATGAATAAAGAVAFVGMVVPHVLRRFYGYRPSQLILPSALGGAALVTAADVAIHIFVPDGQLHLGVLTAMLGAPFFFWLILKLRREM